MKNNWELYISNNIELTKTAYKYCSSIFSHQELIDELSSDDEIKKQLCILNIETIKSQEEADALIKNMTEKGGPIRESCALKINELIHHKEYSHFFQNKFFLDTFLKALVDINPTVSRNMVETIEKIEQKTYLIEKIYTKIFESLDELRAYNLPKSYLLNKKTFKLYWYLEALFHLINFIELDDKIENILEETAVFNDYTIREKCSKILSAVKSPTKSITNLKCKLKEDENIFVRRHLITKEKV